MMSIYTFTRTYDISVTINKKIMKKGGGEYNAELPKFVTLAGPHTTLQRPCQWPNCVPFAGKSFLHC